MTLDQRLIFLYQAIDSCRFCQKNKNPLQHIHGYGSLNPDFLLVLVNPTHRNISSRPKYRGERFPFIGVRQFWRVLGEAGLINPDLAERLPPGKDWSKVHTDLIKRELLKNKLFITNLVKCCYNNGNYPNKKVIKEQLRFLKAEIKIINPRKIIAFGGLVFKCLTGKSVVLSDYWNKEPLREYPEIITGLKIPVIPVYFPVGRGNSAKAVVTLARVIQKQNENY